MPANHPQPPHTTRAADPNGTAALITTLCASLLPRPLYPSAPIAARAPMVDAPRPSRRRDIRAARQTSKSNRQC